MNQQVKPILRGDIYYADLSPVVGCEQGGVRPVLIIQNNLGNRHSPTVIVAAVTGSPKKPLPTHVPITDVNGVSKRSMVLLEQIRTLDRTRLRDYIGSVGIENLSKIDKALKISVGLDSAFFNEGSSYDDKHSFGTYHYTQSACRDDADAESPVRQRENHP
ncbi:type II toxin-antitoxin system PemK/MazF family toxin [Anaerotruncus rubiinfantis]|uniref:type II toxin-antitoxin system PemK/MazF family toxin n=1 Tax=Anaerotruncus rubiinfantis TaxID=1720200 RepID=UPI00082BB658